MPQEGSVVRVVGDGARRHLVLAARVVVASAALVVSGSAWAAPPAEAAVGGDHLVGHRCRTYDPAVTNENTVRAMADTSQVAGAFCEIDTWRIADGTQIVWHDGTWGRVADHDTLPAGVLPTDPVKNATWAQVSQIRTKGGSPVPRLAQMIDASARYGVPLIVEVRNSVANPGSWETYARSRGADVAYYKTPASTCAVGELDRLSAGGAPIGVKMPGPAGCQMTPSQLEAKGVSFVTEDASRITTSYTSALRARGIVVYVRGAGKDTAQSLIDKGAERVLADRPRDALSWFS